jgi:hypothetical protein
MAVSISLYESEFFGTGALALLRPVPGYSVLLTYA